jgi:integrase
VELLDGIVARGAPIQANRVLEVVRKMFNFAIEKEIVENNPCYLVKRPSQEREGQRVLTFEEIRKIWVGIEKQNPIVAGIFKLRLLTAQRGIEIRSMRESDIERETNIWTIPADRAKNGLQHRVPLSPQALSIIDGLVEHRKGTPFIFPGPHRGKNQHITSIQKAVLRIREASGGICFVDRDFRRTVASHMAGQLKIPRLVISMVLNHVDPSITRVYDRHSYDEEKRDALHRWGEFLEQIITTKSLNAVPSQRKIGAVSL